MKTTNKRRSGLKQITSTTVNSILVLVVLSLASFFSFLHASQTEVFALNPWTASDFTYRDTPEGRAVTGFTWAGLEKIKSEKHLIIPAVDELGQPVEVVASFAFNLLIAT